MRRLLGIAILLAGLAACDSGTEEASCSDFGLATPFTAEFCEDLAEAAGCAEWSFEVIETGGPRPTGECQFRDCDDSPVEDCRPDTTPP